MGVGVAGADPKAVGLARRLLVGRDQELERLTAMIDQVGAAGFARDIIRKHHHADGEGDGQRAEGGTR